MKAARAKLGAIVVSGQHSAIIEFFPVHTAILAVGMLLDVLGLLSKRHPAAEKHHDENSHQNSANHCHAPPFFLLSFCPKKPFGSGGDMLSSALIFLGQESPYS
jgi:hypothetical protein